MSVDLVREYGLVMKKTELARKKLEALMARSADFKRKAESFGEKLCDLKSQRQATIGRVAVGEIPESKLSEIAIKIEDCETQKGEARALAEAVAEAILNIKVELETLQDEDRRLRQSIWSSQLAPLAAEIKKVIGDRMQRFWIALANSGYGVRVLSKAEVPSQIEFLCDIGSVEIERKFWFEIIGK